jgi:hypothetical protein
MKRLLSLSVFSAVLAGAFSVHSADLKQSKFTQVVNDVQVISASDKTQKPAAANQLFKLPDIIRTGPASRAEMIAEDKTITRVGANTIFSFDAATRTIDLEKGSLLFHSPKGKGGGTIKSGSAIAAVLGTTIMVGSTPDGGFKVVVLEGTAKVKLNNGHTQTLHAGEMVFVLPGNEMSPVITFRLDLLTGGSLLVKGFDQPLPTTDLINLEIEKQNNLLKEGKVEDTGLIVGYNATQATVEAVDPNVLPPNFVIEKPPLDEPITPAALGLDAIIDAPTLEQAHLFLKPTEVKNSPFTGNFVGFFARDISFVAGSETVDLTPYHQLPSFTFLASRNIHIKNSVHFSGNSTVYGDLALIAAGTITVSPESTIDYNGSGFFVQALGSLSFDSITFRNQAGVMEVSSAGSLTVKNSSILGYGVTLSGVSGLSLQDVYLSGYGSFGERAASTQNAVSAYGNVNIASSGAVQIKSSYVEANRVTVSGNSINLTDGNIYADTLTMHAAEQINIKNTYLSLNTVNLSAKTIILNNVNFQSSSYVYLQSQLGQLAANPNTGASPVAGKVNFINNVLYGGDVAQNHINPEFGPGIFIYGYGQPKPTPGTTGQLFRASSKINPLKLSRNSGIFSVTQKTK